MKNNILDIRNKIINVLVFWLNVRNKKKVRGIYLILAKIKQENRKETNPNKTKKKVNLSVATVWHRSRRTTSRGKISFCVKQ